MRVPGRFFLSDSLATTLEEGAVKQLANVATMPGIVSYSLAMPDIHWGYGFPIGGVAAFRKDGGVISPGGVGFDINCGVRLFTTPLKTEDLQRKRELIERLFNAVPTGVGARSIAQTLGQGTRRDDGGRRPLGGRPGIRNGVRHRSLRREGTDACRQMSQQ